MTDGILLEHAAAIVERTRGRLRAQIRLHLDGTPALALLSYLTVPRHSVAGYIAQHMKGRPDMAVFSPWYRIVQRSNPRAPSLNDLQGMFTLAQISELLWSPHMTAQCIAIALELSSAHDVSRRIETLTGYTLTEWRKRLRTPSHFVDEAITVVETHRAAMRAWRPSPKRGD